MFFKKLFIPYLIIIAICFSIFGCQSTGVRERLEIEAEPISDGQVATVIDSLEIRKTVTELVSFGSRVAGYPGATQAAHYLAERMRNIGLEDIQTH